MFWDIGMHRMDEAKIIDNFADLGEDIADPFSALAILLKAKVGGGQSPLVLRRDLRSTSWGL